MTAMTDTLCILNSNMILRNGWNFHIHIQGDCVVPMTEETRYNVSMCHKLDKVTEMSLEDVSSVLDMVASPSVSQTGVKLV